MNLELAHVATDDGNIVPMDKTQAQAIELTLAEVDALRHDELLELEFAVDLHQDERCISPVFNYAWFLPWVQAVEDVSKAFQVVSNHFYNHGPVDPSIDWVPVKIDQKLSDDNCKGTKTQYAMRSWKGPWNYAEFTSSLDEVSSVDYT